MQKNSQPHKLHIWFLPTLKSNSEKPKEQFLAYAHTDMKIFILIL